LTTKETFDSFALGSISGVGMVERRNHKKFKQTFSWIVVIKLHIGGEAVEKIKAVLKRCGIQAPYHQWHLRTFVFRSIFDKRKFK
jgi:hypothetical protein